MPAYVLVEFDDNAKAKKFVEKVNGEYAAVDPQYSTRRVRAVWGKPTKFCECTGGEKGANPFTRGFKTGWWVHAACGRPTKNWALGNHWFSALGRNMLPGNKDYLPGGWGIMRDFDQAIVTPTLSDTRPTDESTRKAARRAERKKLKAERPRRA